MAIVLLTWLPAVPAGAQSGSPQQRINSALARAPQVGIPPALLENKIAEGKAKGVSLDRIAVAIERRLAALERASAALGTDADAIASLGVGADAIESGVSESVLKAVSESAPNGRRTVAIAALTELVKQGDSPAAALDRVKDALKRGPDALSNLPAEGAKGRRVGQTDGQKGNANGKSSADTPSAAVPAPGNSPQAGRPDNPGQGQGQGQGGGNDPPGRGRSGGNPGRGGQ
jgi:hypothetical protein